MSNKNPLPQRIKEWLNNREITDGVLKEYDIGWNGHQIVIPVHDSKGQVVFNKYRRDPESKEGPKYQYEKGATSRLYGMKTINLKNNKVLFIVEGEMDCLCMKSKGYQTISSTGGAGTFKEEWANYLNLIEDLEVYICLDTDDAGINGALKIHSMIKGSRIIKLPKECKDITEYFVKLKKTRNHFNELVTSSMKYMFPKDWRELKTKKELNDILKEYKEYSESYKVIARKIRELYGSDKYEEKIIQLYLNKIEEVKRAIKYFQVKREDINNNRLLEAKKVPIDIFLKFDRQDNTCCIFHSERTPSLHYYRENNRFKCFGCGKSGDVIDLVQEINKCSLVEAIKIILGK